MIVRSHINSLYHSFSYALNGIIIDPGDIWDGFHEARAVLLTHAHFDHIYGLNELIKLSPDAKVYTNDVGRDTLLDARKNLSFYHETPFVFDHPESIISVSNDETIELGNGLCAKAVFTPGHHPSCITWVIGDSLFTGDSLIPGVKTVTNLPKGNLSQASESEARIKALSSERTIFPGHKI